MNYYGDFDTANRYLTNSLDAFGKWDAYTKEVKETLLLGAAQKLDQLIWVGVLNEPMQEQAFPRHYDALLESERFQGLIPQIQNEMIASNGGISDWVIQSQYEIIINHLKFLEYEQMIAMRDAGVGLTELGDLSFEPKNVRKQRYPLPDKAWDLAKYWTVKYWNEPLSLKMDSGLHTRKYTGRSRYGDETK